MSTRLITYGDDEVDRIELGASLSHLEALTAAKAAFEVDPGIHWAFYRWAPRPGKPNPIKVLVTDSAWATLGADVELFLQQKILRTSPSMSSSSASSEGRTEAERAGAFASRLGGVLESGLPGSGHKKGDSTSPEPAASFRPVAPAQSERENVKAHSRSHSLESRVLEPDRARSPSRPRSPRLLSVFDPPHRGVSNYGSAGSAESTPATTPSSSVNGSLVDDAISRAIAAQAVANVSRTRLKLGQSFDSTFAHPLNQSLGTNPHPRPQQSLSRRSSFDPATRPSFAPPIPPPPYSPPKSKYGHLRRMSISSTVDRLERAVSPSSSSEASIGTPADRSPVMGVASAVDDFRFGNEFWAVKAPTLRSVKTHANLHERHEVWVPTPAQRGLRSGSPRPGLLSSNPPVARFSSGSRSLANLRVQARTDAAPPLPLTATTVTRRR